MNGINLGRVLVGGLLAGLVMNIVDAVTGLTVMEPEMEAMAVRLNLDPTLMASIWPWVAIDFMYGIVIVFTYAAMRPRFGIGPKTAIIAALTLALAVTLILSGFAAIGLFTSTMLVKGCLGAIVASVLAGIAGGWAYKE